MPKGGGASPPDPLNQGIQSYVLFGDLEIRRSEILRNETLKMARTVSSKVEKNGIEISF